MLAHTCRDTGLIPASLLCVWSLDVFPLLWEFRYAVEGNEVS